MDDLMPFLGFAMGAGLLVVTIWILARHTQFRVSQLVSAAFAFGLALMPLKSFLIDKENSPGVFAFLTACLLALTGIGLHIGANNEHALLQAHAWKRRIVFLSGLILPLAIVPTIIAVFVLYMKAVDSIPLGFSFDVIASIFTLCVMIVCSAVTYTCRLRGRQDDGQR